MFPSLAARKTYVAETNFTARKQENVFTKSVYAHAGPFVFRNNVSSFSDWDSKTFYFLPANLASPETFNKKQCFLV